MANTNIPDMTLPSGGIPVKSLYLLTDKGWKNPTENLEGLKICSLNVEDETISFQPFTVNISDYDGELINFSNKFINEAVSPSQEYPLYGKLGNYKGNFSAKQIMTCDIEGQMHSYIPKQGKWIGQKHDPVTLKGISEKDITFEYPTFLRLLAFYLINGTSNRDEIRMVYRKNEICDEIETIMLDNHINFSIREGKRNFNIYTITSPLISRYLKKITGDGFKHIPEELLQGTPDEISIFIQWYSLASSEKIRHKNSELYSPNKQQALRLNELQFKAGLSGTFRECEYYDENDTSGNECNVAYLTGRIIQKGIPSDCKSLESSKIYYKGKIASIYTEPNIWYAMINGHTHWMGGIKTN